MTDPVFNEALRAIASYVDAVGCDPRRIVTTPALYDALLEEAGPQTPAPLAGSYRGQLSLDGIPVVADVTVPPGTMYCDEKSP